MDDDRLESFRGGNDANTSAETKSFERTLLVFRLGPHLVGVRADAVDSVIGWKDPAPLPGGSNRFMGVVQDRGRVVAVTKDALETRLELADCRRLVVCRSGRGLVAFPATDTDSVEEVSFPVEPLPGRAEESSRGPITIIDPTSYVESGHG